MEKKGQKCITLVYTLSLLTWSLELELCHKCNKIIVSYSKVIVGNYIVCYFQVIVGNHIVGYSKVIVGNHIVGYSNDCSS